MQTQPTNGSSSNCCASSGSSCSGLSCILLGWLVHPSDGVAMHDTKPYLRHWQLGGRVRLVRNCQVVAVTTQPWRSYHRYTLPCSVLKSTDDRHNQLHRGPCTETQYLMMKSPGCHTCSYWVLCLSGPRNVLQQSHVAASAACQGGSDAQSGQKCMATRRGSRCNGSCTCRSHPESAPSSEASPSAAGACLCPTGRARSCLQDTHSPDLA
jgi:hypothetical protein